MGFTLKIEIATTLVARCIPTDTGGIKFKQAKQRVVRAKRRSSANRPCRSSIAYYRRLARRSQALFLDGDDARLQNIPKIYPQRERSRHTPPKPVSTACAYTPSRDDVMSSLRLSFAILGLRVCHRYITLRSHGSCTLGNSDECFAVTRILHSSSEPPSLPPSSLPRDFHGERILETSDTIKRLSVKRMMFGSSIERM